MEEKALRVLVVDDNPDDSRLVQEMLTNVEGQSFEVFCADSLMNALDTLANREFDVAVVDLGLTDSQGLATFETIQRHADRLPIVVYTGVSNESLALTAVARGAQDYLVKGRMTSQALVRVLRYSMARQHKGSPNGDPEKARAPVIGFVGAKGGVGTTTLAAHFAIAWKRQTGQSVLLLDLDITSASSDFLMRTGSKYTILDAATNLHRLDVAYWNGLVTHAEQGIDVLPSPGAVNFGEQLVSERVRHVLRFARPLYQCIVTDLSRVNPLALNLLEEIGTLYVVSNTELPSFCAVSRVLKKLIQLAMAPAEVRLIFNRVPKTIPNPVPEMEKALGYRAYACIGDFPAELAEAYGYGKMLDEGSGFHKQVARLAAKSLGIAAPPEGKGLRHLFRRVLA